MTTTYTTRSTDPITYHSTSSPAWFVHDAASEFRDLELDAFVASGDCFEMLASNLDQISSLLADDDSAQPELEHIIRLLLGLQHRYKVVRKLPSDRSARF